MTLQYPCQTKFLPVILNEAAGVVKDLVERDRPVILNEAAGVVKDLVERDRPVILNGAAGVVNDLVERDRPVILNGVKDLGERNNAFILCGYGEVYQILR